MNDLKRFLTDKKVKLLEEYDFALDRNMIFQAKSIRIKMSFLEELLKEVE